MGILSNAGENAGLGSAKVIKQTVEGALDTVDHETIPAAEQAARAIVNQALYGVAGVIADLTNRANGAEIPIDITIRIQGKIGPLKLNVPAEMPAQTVEVQG